MIFDKGIVKSKYPNKYKHRNKYIDFCESKCAYICCIFVICRKGEMCQGV